MAKEGSFTNIYAQFYLHMKVIQINTRTTCSLSDCSFKVIHITFLSYRDEHCIPHNCDGNSAIIVNEDGSEIICPMNDLLAHQWKKLLQTRPDVKEKIIKTATENPLVGKKHDFKKYP